VGCRLALREATESETVDLDDDEDQDYGREFPEELE
jgi:hypothetical protein